MATLKTVDYEPTFADQPPATPKLRPVDYTPVFDKAPTLREVSYTPSFDVQEIDVGFSPESAVKALDSAPNPERDIKSRMAADELQPKTEPTAIPGKRAVKSLQWQATREQLNQQDRALEEFRSEYDSAQDVDGGKMVRGKVVTPEDYAKRIDGMLEQRTRIESEARRERHEIPQNPIELLIRSDKPMDSFVDAVALQRYLIHQQQYMGEAINLDKDEAQRVYDNIYLAEKKLSDNMGKDGRLKRAAKGAAGSTATSAESLLTGPGMGAYWFKQGEGSFTYEIIKAAGGDLSKMSEEQLRDISAVAKAGAVPYAATEYALTRLPGMRLFGSDIATQAARRWASKIAIEKVGLRKAAQFTVEQILTGMGEYIEEIAQGGIEGVTEEQGRVLLQTAEDLKKNPANYLSAFQQKAAEQFASAPEVALSSLFFAGVGHIQNIPARQQEREIRNELKPGRLTPEVTEQVVELLKSGKDKEAETLARSNWNPARDPSLSALESVDGRRMTEDDLAAVPDDAARSSPIYAEFSKTLPPEQALLSTKRHMVSDLVLEGRRQVGLRDQAAQQYPEAAQDLAAVPNVRAEHIVRQQELRDQGLGVVDARDQVVAEQAARDRQTNPLASGWVELDDRRAMERRASGLAPILITPPVAAEGESNEVQSVRSEAQADAQGQVSAPPAQNGAVVPGATDVTPPQSVRSTVGRVAARQRQVLQLAVDEAMQDAATARRLNPTAVPAADAAVQAARQRLEAFNQRSARIGQPQQEGAPANLAPAPAPAAAPSGRGSTLPPAARPPTPTPTQGTQAPNTGTTGSAQPTGASVLPPTGRASRQMVQSQAAAKVRAVVGRIANESAASRGNTQEGDGDAARQGGQPDDGRQGQRNVRDVHDRRQRGSAAFRAEVDSGTADARGTVHAEAAYDTPIGRVISRLAERDGNTVVFVTEASKGAWDHNGLRFENGVLFINASPGRNQLEAYLHEAGHNSFGKGDAAFLAIIDGLDPALNAEFSAAYAAWYQRATRESLITRLPDGSVDTSRLTEELACDIASGNLDFSTRDGRRWSLLEVAKNPDQTAADVERYHGYATVRATGTPAAASAPTSTTTAQAPSTGPPGDPASDGPVKASPMRPEEYPKKTVTAYKLFRTLKSRPGEIFPLFIGATTPVPMNQWVRAEYIPTKGFAERPGWHAGVLPSAPHLMKKDGSMPEDRVWAEVEISADRDWQTEADQSKTRDIRGRIPEGGYYRFATPKLQGGSWIVGGALKVKRLMTAAEVSKAQPKASPTRRRVESRTSPNRVTPEQDAEYLRAVESGDMQTAQRMVDEAARKAGFTSGPWYHGTPIGRFNRFDKHQTMHTGFHFGDDATAGKFAFMDGAEGDVIRAYLNVVNPIRMDDLGEWSGDQFALAFRRAFRDSPQPLTQDESENLRDVDSPDNDDVFDILYKRDHDAIIYRNNAEGDGSDSIMVLNPSQIKSADPVTRHDDGTVIPLSERFNDQTPDIRFSPRRDTIESLRRLGDTPPIVRTQDAPHPVNPVKIATADGTSTPSMIMPSRWPVFEPDEDKRLRGQYATEQEFVDQVNVLRGVAEQFAKEHPELADRSAMFYRGMATSALSLARIHSGKEDFALAELYLRMLAYLSPRSNVPVNTTKSFGSGIAPTMAGFTPGYKAGTNVQIEGMQTIYKEWLAGKAFSLNLQGVANKVENFYLNGISELIRIANSRNDSAAEAKLVAQAGSTIGVTTPADGLTLEQTITLNLLRRVTGDMWHMSAAGRVWPGYVLNPAHPSSKEPKFVWSDPGSARTVKAGTSEFDSVMADLSNRGEMAAQLQHNRDLATEQSMAEWVRKNPAPSGAGSGAGLAEWRQKRIEERRIAADVATKKIPFSLKHLSWQEARALRLNGREWTEAEWAVERTKIDAATATITIFDREVAAAAPATVVDYDVLQHATGEATDRMNSAGSFRGRTDLTAYNTQEIVWGAEKYRNPLPSQRDFAGFHDVIRELEAVLRAARRTSGIDPRLSDLFPKGYSLVTVAGNAVDEMVAKELPHELVTSNAGTAKTRYDAAAARLRSLGDTMPDTTLAHAWADWLARHGNAMFRRLGMTLRLRGVSAAVGGFYDSDSGVYSVSPNIVPEISGSSDEAAAFMRALSEVTGQSAGNLFRLPTPLEVAAGDRRITPLIEFDVPAGWTDAQHAALGNDLFAIKDAGGNAFLTGFTPFPGAVAIHGGFYNGDFGEAVDRSSYDIEQVLRNHGLSGSFEHGQRVIEKYERPTQKATEANGRRAKLLARRQGSVKNDSLPVLRGLSRALDTVYAGATPGFRFAPQAVNQNDLLGDEIGAHLRKRYQSRSVKSQTSTTLAQRVNGAWLRGSLTDAQRASLLGRLGVDLKADATGDESTAKASPRRPPSSPEFKAWFRGSKVVDPDGEALEVYHGTAGDFDEAQIPDHGFWATTAPKYASGIADVMALKRGGWVPEWSKGGNVMPVYLSIKNPYRATPEQLRADGIAVRDVEGSTSPGFKEILRWARIRGNDGVFIPGEIRPKADERDADTWVVLNSASQIKSAIGNSGAFSPESGNMKASPKRDAAPPRQVSDRISEAALNPVVEKTLREAIAGQGLTGKQAAQAYREGVQRIIASRRARVAARSGEMRQARTAQLEVTAGAREQGEEYAGVKNAFTAEVRQRLGLKPTDRIPTQTNEATMDEAFRRLAENPGLLERMVTELGLNARPVDHVETAMLDIAMVEAMQGLDRTAKDLERVAAGGDRKAIAAAQTLAEQAQLRLIELGEINRATGRLLGLGLQMRARMLAEDYTLAGLLRRALVATGGKVTPEQIAALDALAKRYEARLKLADQAAAEREARAAQAAYDEAIKDFEAANPPMPEMVRKIADDIVADVKVYSAPARAKLGTLFAVTAKASPGRANRRAMTARGVDPDVMRTLIDAGADIITDGAATFESWRDTLLAEAGALPALYEARLADIYEASRERIQASGAKVAAKTRGTASKRAGRAAGTAVAAGKARPPTTPESIMASLKALVDSGEYARLVEDERRKALRNVARALARHAIQSGVKGRDAVLKSVHASMETVIPGLTSEETMKAIAGYGIYSLLDREAVSEELRKVTGELQQLSKLSDMAKGIPPQKTGVERRTPSDEERRLIKLVEEAKRRGGYRVTDPLTQLRTALEASYRAVTNAIKDLEKEIADRQYILRTKTPGPTDAGLQALQQKRDELRKIRDELLGPRAMSDAQREAMALRGLDRSIADLEARLASGELKPFPTGRRSSWSQEIAARRARLEALRDQRDELLALRDPKRTPEELALAALKSRASRKLAELRQRLAEKDFAPRKRVPKKVALDDEAKAALFELEKVKREVNEKMLEWKIQNFDPLKKAFDKGINSVNLFRAFVTSFDNSAIGRQGWYIALTMPGVWARNIPVSFRAMRSEAAEFEINEEIRNRDTYARMKAAKLYIAEDGQDLSKLEEAYQSRWAKKVPGIGMSARAYTAFLNKLRADAFDHMAGLMGVEAGNPEADKIIANFINKATGRGGLGSLENGNAPVHLAALYFSPRFVASRLQMLAFEPIWSHKSGWHKSELKQTAAARKLVARMYVRGVLTWIAMRALLAMAMGEDDDDLEKATDARGSDFGKLKIGNVSFDFLAGLAPSIVLVSRLLTGKRRTSKGEISPIRGESVPYGAPNARELVEDFLEQKEAPMPRILWQLANGEMGYGQELTKMNFAGNFVPMLPRDIYQAFDEAGVGPGVAAAAAAYFGVGVNTRTPPAPTSKRRKNPYL